MLQENVVIEVERRSETGKNACNRLREKDLIPAVLYGGGAGMESMPLSVPRKSLLGLFRKGIHQNVVFLLQLKGTEEKRHVMVRDVTLSPLRRELIHVDFLRILLDRKMKMKVAVEVVGIAAGSSSADPRRRHPRTRDRVPPGRHPRVDPGRRLRPRGW
ncbi:MAG: 50S ribosomal protein L25 [Holophagales bacterium]|nr:50S ribosomal protein L25 [Holophagales bacterium]